MPSNQNQWLYIILAFAAGVAVGANWPEIRQKIAPLLNAGNQKFGDLYAYLAQLMSEQKENFEDSRAEQKFNKEKAGKAHSQEDFVASIAQMMAGMNKEKLAENLAKFMTDAPAAETKKKRTVKRKVRTRAAGTGVARESAV